MKETEGSKDVGDSFVERGKAGGALLMGERGPLQATAGL